jgi:nicotinamidase-related amidase
MMHSKKRQLIEGQPVLVVIDIQGGEPESNEPSAMPFMPDYQEHMDRAPALIEKARECNVPVVFVQEAHRRDLIDLGRELDSAEDIHLLEGDPGTEIAKAVGMRSDDYFVRKRRYSCFFGTDFEILMKGLRADTLIMIGGHTDVCVHYSFFWVFLKLPLAFSSYHLADFRLEPLSVIF